MTKKESILESSACKCKRKTEEVVIDPDCGKYFVMVYCNDCGERFPDQLC